MLISTWTCSKLDTSFMGDDLQPSELKRMKSSFPALTAAGISDIVRWEQILLAGTRVQFNDVVTSSLAFKRPNPSLEL